MFLTDNNVLVNKLKPQPALMCAQRKAEKIIPTEEDFIKSNIESFGNDIGQTTNWITSMFEVQSRFDKDSEEYKTLAYRIQCGQLYQQNTIDKAKGIICKPMPKNWHDRYAVNRMEDEKEFYRRIVADKKPYFMKYIYPALMKEYNTYIRNTKQNSLREFDLTVPELKAIPKDELTERQAEFLYYYDLCMPVGVGDCVMNRICRRFEAEFDGYIAKHNSTVKFDYTIMKSDAEYSSSQFYAIKRLYEEYNKRVQSYVVFSNYERVDEYEYADELQVMAEDFRHKCEAICPDKAAMCNLILDLCYTRSSTKKFAWAMCGHEIIANLLSNHNNEINFPVLDADGDMEYDGDHYSVVTVKMEVNDFGD